MKAKRLYLTLMASCILPYAHAADSLFVQDAKIKNENNFEKLNGRALAANAQQAEKVISQRAQMKLTKGILAKDKFEIDLSDGRKISVAKLNRYTSNLGSTVWVGGRVGDVPSSKGAVENQIYLVENGGQLTGTIYNQGKIFQIQRKSDDSYALQEIQYGQIPDHPLHISRTQTSTSSLPTFAPARIDPNVKTLPEIADFDQEKYAALLHEIRNKKARSTTTQTINSLAASSSTLPAVIRVLVNYTPAFRTAVGGTDALARAKIDSYLAQSNQAYNQSKINLRVQLAHAAAISFTETNSTTTDLQNYRANSIVQSQRQTYLADLSILIRSPQTLDSCGQAMNIRPLPTDAYAVAARTCADGNFTFQHEMAHLYGARHDRANDPSLTPYAWGHGFVWPDVSKRTVMAYPTGASVRVNYFSNPEVVVDGVAVGTWAYENNARVHNDEANSVRNYSAAPIRYLGSRANFSIIKNSTGFHIKDHTIVGDAAYELLPNAETRNIEFDNFWVNTQVGNNAKTISSSDLNALVELYIAFMNRVPDADGLNYWISELKRGLTLNQIAESFYSAALLYPALTGYTASMTHTDFIIKVYKNVLSRDVISSDTGVQYWAGQLSSGAQSRGQVVFNLLNSAHSFKGDPTWGWTADFLDNKLLVGKYFALEQSLSYKIATDNVSQGMEIIKRVAPTNVQTAKNYIGITNDPSCNLFQ